MHFVFSGRMNNPSLEAKHDKANRPVKVIQFGTGNFLRGFADWMIDILNEKTDFDGSVHLVQTHGKTIPQTFVDQNFRYHVWLRGISNGEPVDTIRQIACIEGISNPRIDYAYFLELAALPELQWLISNTTEAGIYFDENDKDPGICPASFPGKLCVFLYARYLHFVADPHKGLFILPCELLEDNGNQLKQMVTRYSELWGLSPKFIDWVEESCTFCNTLVDRIVPGFPKENQEEFIERAGLSDAWAVSAEPYHFWAIQGPKSLEPVFNAGATGLNVQIVNDLSPYRLQKVRILNGAHTAMVPIAYLAGIRTVRDAIEDPKIGEIVRETIFREIIPTLDLPYDELEEYAGDVLDRFRNPHVRHELASIALNSIAKFKVRVLPTILEYQHRNDAWPKYLCRSFAALLVFYSGTWKCEPIPLNDSPEVLEFFRLIWESENCTQIVQAALGQVDFWGEDLNKRDGLAEILVSEIEMLQIHVD